MRTVDCQFNTQGGMVDVAALRLLAESAAEHGAGTLRFTSDQKIVIHGMMESRALHLKSQLGVSVGDIRDSYPNIVTTAPVAGIGMGRPWLRKSSFTDVLEKFDFTPSSQVYIADPTQPYLPTIYGQINVLADTVEDQWRIMVTHINGEASAATGVLRGAYVAEAVRRIEIFKSDPVRANFGDLELTDLLSDLLRSAKKETFSPSARCHLAPETLTLSQPQGGWDAEFLQDLCLFALQQDISSLGLTPWRSITLSRLTASQIHSFEERCFQRRAAPEQNPWRQWLLVESGCEALADNIFKMLYQVSTGNPGYAIAVQNSPQFAGTPIVVCPDQGNRGRFNFRKRYSLWRRAEGNTNNTKMQLHAAALPLERVHLDILNLLDGWTTEQPSAPTIEVPPALRHSEAYRCAECASEYDARYGDTLGAVPAETSFDNLPHTWVCPVCEAPKQAYHLISI